MIYDVMQRLYSSNVMSFLYSLYNCMNIMSILYFSIDFTRKHVVLWTKIVLTHSLPDPFKEKLKADTEIGY